MDWAWFWELAESARVVTTSQRPSGDQLGGEAVVGDVGASRLVRNQMKK